MRIFLSDRHEASACGCEAVIRELDKDALIYRAMERCDVLAVVEEHPDVDLILWHVHDQPEMDFEILRSLSCFAIGIPIVVLADRSSPAQVLRALKFGVKGYVDLPAKKDLLLAIFRLVLAGGCYCPAFVLSDEEPDPAAEQDDKSLFKAEQRQLTPRQEEVLKFLVAGHTNKEIAAKLDISPATVKLHVAAVLRAVDADARDKLISIGENRRTRFQEHK